MDEPIIPQAAEFRIHLPTFEGPLDLLLHLIKKHELNILDLPISFVTESYLGYLKMMQELDLDIASEYLLMAATLAHIKSKQLLPAAPSDNLEEQEQAAQEDPRAELIRRLLEYQKYKAAAEQLGGRPLAGRDVFQRGMPAPEAHGPAPLAEIDLYKLLDAFQSILKRVQGRVALEVSAERITIHERMTQLSDFLRLKRSCMFEELFEGVRTRYEVVVTFLALLEMTKLRMTRIYQADPKSALHVQYALLDADSPTIPPDEELGGTPTPATEPALDASVATESESAGESLESVLAGGSESEANEFAEDDDSPESLAALAAAFEADADENAQAEELDAAPGALEQAAVASESFDEAPTEEVESLDAQLASEVERDLDAAEVAADAAVTDLDRALEVGAVAAVDALVTAAELAPDAFEEAPTDEMAVGTELDVSSVELELLAVADEQPEDPQAQSTQSAGAVDDREHTDPADRAGSAGPARAADEDEKRAQDAVVDNRGTELTDKTADGPESEDASDNDEWKP